MLKNAILDAKIYENVANIWRNFDKIPSFPGDPWPRARLLPGAVDAALRRVAAPLLLERRRLLAFGGRCCVCNPAVSDLVERFDAVKFGIFQ